MGLDLAELILDIEESYAVELDNDDCANIYTFGDLIDTVKRKIDRPLDLSIEESGHEIILQSLLAELRLRLPKNVEINEETQLRKLRRYEKNHKIWSFVQKRFPELPSWYSNDLRLTVLNHFITLSSLLGVGVVGVLILSIILDFFEESLLTILVYFVILYMVGTFLFFWQVGRQPHQMVSDFAKDIAERRQKLLKVREYSSEDIENELRDYMSKAFALRPEKILRESELVKDLGLG